MAEQYNREYYEQYDVGVGKVNYEDSEYTRGFLEEMAQRIVEDLAPKTVLDAGCAMGHLVAALRDRGVEAYGIDISEYAISRVREDIKPYCVVGSLTEPLPDSLPQKYDLVVTIEVLEHLYPEDGAKAIKNLCAVTDTVIFSSTPDDFMERTHVNVQQREYWARQFAENGFLDDICYRPTYLTYHAVCYRRSSNWLRQVENYERNLRISEAEATRREAEWTKAVHDKEVHIQNLNRTHSSREVEWAAAIHDKEVHIQNLNRIHSAQEAEYASLEERYTEVSERLAQCEKDYYAAIRRQNELEKQAAQARYEYNVIANAFFWKITKPFRVLTDWLKKPFRNSPKARLVWKGLRSLKKNGVRYTWKKVKGKLFSRNAFSKATKPLFTPKELEAQRADMFSQDITISILVPLYNTPKRFLREMIQSVLDQTYGNWELCLADGSDEKHYDVKRICCRYAKRDCRIKYRKLEENLGISGNTNACIEMSSGEYIALFDHDDLLHPAALHEVMKAICDKKADFIYTDENTFHNKPEDAYCPNFKPDYAPDTLRSYNYICHLSVFSRQLLQKAGGGFRSEFDGSQDYDMVLRLTEKAEHIVHIPKILYYWRAHDSSVAADISAKPYTIIAAKNAIAAHLERMGLKGKVLDSRIPSTYRIQYQIEGSPLISILIPSKDHVADLQKCITSIMEKTTYPAWEIVVVENGSTSEETFAYYEKLQEDNRIRVVQWDRGFNYSAINNFGFQYTKGEFVLLLNNDIEVITPDWLQQMLMFCQRKDVGAVGCMLYYPDDTIQHAGVILGLGGVAGHSHKYANRGECGYMYRLALAQNLSAITAACMMVRRDVWKEINGLDESFQVAFNDVDLCMRIRQAGYLIVWTPYAELYHYESKSRGQEDTPEKQARFAGEVHRFQERWRKELAEGDPYYNPNFTLDREDFSLQ